jgi:hypothetical protein
VWTRTEGKFSDSLFATTTGGRAPQEGDLPARDIIGGLGHGPKLMKFWYSDPLIATIGLPQRMGMNFKRGADDTEPSRFTINAYTLRDVDGLLLALVLKATGAVDRVGLRDPRQVAAIIAGGIAPRS